MERTTLALEDVEVSRVQVATAPLPSRPGFFVLGDDNADDFDIILPDDQTADDAII